MLTDDLTALAAISMGAVASAALTLALTSGEVDARPLAAPGVQVAAAPALCAAPRQIIDFAIVRSGGDRRAVHLMVGPEGTHSGWDAQSGALRLRLQRGR